MNLGQKARFGAGDRIQDDVYVSSMTNVVNRVPSWGHVWQRTRHLVHRPEVCA